MKSALLIWAENQMKINTQTGERLINVFGEDIGPAVFPTNDLMRRFAAIRSREDALGKVATSYTWHFINKMDDEGREAFLEVLENS